ncbi:DUF1186 family protein [Clostridium kluyveri]|uniref:DUF1186 domain-containing protein n=2 Tax=Clostridium kluyveri TaxID=1534 RepID=A5MZG3_CLOK5|nr:DUF1186 family protein [Clostridium kluyveri]EDK34259.1 Conserved hypothetical protein [Clostridium kluyveri DSM 555]
MNALLEQIKYANGKFPEEQIRQIISRKEEFIPELIEILRSAEDNYNEILGKPNYFLHIYAAYLLAQFNEEQSFSLIIDLISLPDEIVFKIFGDVVTEDLHRILASVCKGNVQPVKELLENENVNEYIRVAAIKTFPVLWVEGVISKDEIIKYYRSLLKEKLKRERSVVWGSLVSSCCEICPDELYEEIKEAYKDNLIENFYISLEEVEENFDIEDDERILNLKRRGYEFIRDTIKDLEYWPCFQQNIKSEPQNGTHIQRKIADKKKKKRKQVKASRKNQRRK